MAILDEKKLIQLINWAYQSVLTWIGIGLASVIGVVRVLDTIEKLISFKTTLYYGLIITIFISAEKVLDHWILVHDYKNKLSDMDWPFSGPLERPGSKMVDKLLNWLYDQPNSDYILLGLIVVFTTLLLLEQLKPF